MSYGIHHMSDDDLTTVFEGIYKAPIGFAVMELKGDDPQRSPLLLKYINEVGAHTAGAEPSDLVDKEFNQALPEAAGGPLEQGIRTMFETQKPTEAVIHDPRNADPATASSPVAYRVKLLPLGNKLGLATLVDVTTEAALEREFKVERRTGLASRAYFDDKLHEFAQSMSSSAEDLGVLYIDIDKFKYFNDSHGHMCGDEILTSLAERFRKIVPAPLLIARWGGDEFAIITRWNNQHNLELAHKIIDHVAQPLEWNGHRLDIQMSVGFVTAPAGHSVTARGLMRAADGAMYQAKQAGGGMIKEAESLL